MTKQELLNWVISYGCLIIPIAEYKARVIMLNNPKTDGESWIELPIDNSKVRDYTIFRICSNLGIPAPDRTLYMKSLDDQIEDTHNLKGNN